MQRSSVSMPSLLGGVGSSLLTPPTSPQRSSQWSGRQALDFGCDFGGSSRASQQSHSVVSPSRRSLEGVLSPSHGGRQPRAKLDELARRKRSQVPLDRSHDYHQPFGVAYAEVAKARNLNKLDTLFRETDADGSGQISMEEFQEALKKPGAKATFAALGVQPHQALSVFKAFDLDEDGLLSYWEFMTGFRELCETDTDGNGVDINIEELRAANFAKKHGGVGHVDLSPMQPQAANRLPEVQLQRAFVHSAIAQALHPANAAARVTTRRVDMRGTP
mmetsp:Transcript_5679/g.15537  ORF Transcript_5679/g.15537 Transcript_5679/m.15537 type:complete len:275 (+) Transcript_5679:40-864(+)